MTNEYSGRTEELSSERQELSSERQELLELLLDEGGEAVEALPLSFAQQRLWFLAQLEPDSPAYNIAAAVRLRGRLDVGVLKRSLEEIVARHEALRTTFTEDGGRPVQIVAAEMSFAPEFVDLADFAGDGEAEARRLAGDEARRPFDLTRGPLLRVVVLRLREDEHVIALTMHHIVSDGWSMGVLIREMAALYDAFAQGSPSPLAELPIQYADFAAWEREHLQGELVEEQLAYWKRQLGGGIPALLLLTDHARPAVQTHGGARLPVMLPRPLTEALKALSRSEGATLFMTLLAAFQTLLYRYTNQDDISVGSSVAGRTRAEVEGLIGFFLNTLVMRTDLSGSPGFRELLRRVREVALGAYANQDVPIEMLLEVLQPGRSLSHSPLFQVMLIFQNTPPATLKIGDLTLTPIDLDTGTAKFDLTLDLTEAPDGIRGWLEFNSELFDPETAARIISHFQTLLEAIVADPDERIGNLPVMAREERARVLTEWNDTKRESAHEPTSCVGRLFEEQAARTPDAVAVAHEDRSLTYAELNRRANRVAHKLRASGVGPETLVGICVDRSVEMIVGLLAILKSGGAYVPLDPTYPSERLAYMLDDAAIRVLLTQTHLREKFAGRQLTALCLDDDAYALHGEAGDASEANPDANVTAENLAYVIYTSGSTGRPKGVGVSHGAARNYFEAAREEFALKPGDRVLQFASISFDASAEEIYPCLTSGATLVLRTDAMLASASLFLRQCGEWGVTVLDLPVSYWHTLVARLGSEVHSIPDSLRLLILGAEKALPESLEVWQKYAGGRVRVLNTYGPTETTIVSTLCELSCAAGEGATGRAIPIGRPVRNLRNYVLDAMLNPVPVGVAGELYTGGAGLARGYLNHPELTGERFIPDPFGEEPGGRLYRTGDLVRYLADGRIEFLGRADEQVKVRGYRVELGEIEAALGGHESVREAVVVARDDGRGEKRLVAYVVATDDNAPNAVTLRGHLKERLPEYMIPTAFVLLDALPLTKSGKVDRRALPAPDDAARLTFDNEFTAPRTPVEEVLAAAWAEVLGVERVGVGDDFFELGGHSLLATQVISRVREAFRVELPLRSIFESPTLAELAECVEAAIRGGQQLELPPIEPVSREQDLPLSFAQERMWFLRQLHPESVAYHVMRPLRMTGPLDLSLLERSLTEIVRRHEIYRTTFPAVHGRPVQLVHPPHAVELSPVDLRGLPEAEREAHAERVIEAEGQRPFDLQRGPLWRLTLLRLGDEDHLLMFCEHHMVHDGWTEWRLISEFLAIYEALATGAPSPLPELPIQYADFAHWQRQCLAGPALDAQLDYWKVRLAAPPPALELPTDRPRPPAQSFRGDTREVMLAPALVQALNDLSRRQHCTLFMTLFAAFGTLLQRHSGQEDILIGSPIAGRNRAELEGLIGFFVNTLVMRHDGSGDPTFIELLQRTRENALGAYAHQELPFEKLVEELQPERHLNRQPLFQVMFVLHNAPSRELEVSGLTINLRRVHNRTAKFDLLFAVREEAAGLHCVIEYSTDLFDEATILRLLAQFETLLKGIVAHPERRVSDLPLLTEAETHQLLHEWNATRADYPADQSLGELFERQVERTPDATAVMFEGVQLTYRELNARANRLARRLRALGVGAETGVAICMKRSPQMLCAVLGVLKSGGAYVPLDAAYPKERLAYMMADAGAAVVLAHESLAAALPAHSAKLVLFDEHADELTSGGGENLPALTTADNVAYVTYTSGSTGKPKGIAMTQRALLNLLHWMLTHTELPEGARTLQFASLSFDVSFQDIFSTLCSGGTVVMISEEARQDITGLARIMTEREVHRLFIPAVALQQLAEGFCTHGEFSAALRKVIAGSEQLQITPAVVKMFDGLKHAALHNEYGPSEAHVVTELALSGEPEGWPKRPSIGRPISNARIYMLDRRFKPTPVGVPGELYIGGDGLARGYLNRPDLTAERFIPDPFGGGPGARLYRTGDLARYLADGQIEFLGRMDHQLKIRGFRIEPGEIEAVLSQHPAIQEVLVTAYERAAGDKRLLAYVVPQPGAAPTVGELRTHVKAELPEYMIPSAFIMLASLPLTPNGKVDRRALPLPEQSRPELGHEFVAPRTALEAAVADIWCGLLGLERIGIDDNFFELGGHSLLATQVISHVSDAFQTELPLRFIFESPTVGGFVERMRQSDKQPDDLEKIARLLKQLDGLSEEEAQAMLDE